MSKRRRYRDDDDSKADPSKFDKIASPPLQKKKADTLRFDKIFDKMKIASIFMPLKLLGSLGVGISIMSIFLVVLAWGTFVESEYGAAVSGFALYQSRWFAMLIGFLGLNILCSLLVRFPWRRHHLPFLLAHFGILILLAGCFLTWMWGEEAQITLAEGSAGKLALKMNRQHFNLRAIPHGVDSTSQKTYSVDFEPGPFNWEDYNREQWLRRDRKYRDTLWLAMQWGRRDHGDLIVPDAFVGANVKVEVLDYHASSTTQPVPPLELSVLWKKTTRTKTELGEIKELPRAWERLRLAIKPLEHYGKMEFRGTRADMAGDEKVCYFMTNSMAEVEAFQKALPDESATFGTWGQIVLYYNGKTHYLDVDRLLRDTEAERRVPLPGTPFEIGNVRFLARGPVIRFALHTVGGEKEFMALSPDKPEMNVQATVFGVFGAYWIDPSRLKNLPEEQVDPSMPERLAASRLDILQGPDKKLYYRFWGGRSIPTHGIVPDLRDVRQSGKNRPTFMIGDETTDQAEVVLERFVPQDLPGLQIVSLPVGRDRNTEQRVRLRVSVDGREDTFWLRAAYPTVVPLPPEPDQIRYVYGNGRTLSVTWNYNTIDLGFGVFLKRFEKRTEPGTRMSSHYSSLVDFVAMGDKSFSRSQNELQLLQEDVLIKMNQPAVFQGHNRRYRIYQSSYQGPYHPGDLRFQELYDGKIFPWEKKPRESVFMSTLSINDDPGRGLKYLGCFLIIFGCALFFYFKP